MQAARLSLIPGRGNLAVNDRRRAIISRGLMLGTMARALMLDAQARQRYSEYQSARDEFEAEVTYESVRDLRRQRGLMLSVAGIVWIYDAVSAMRGAERRAQRIADDGF